MSSLLSRLRPLPFAAWVALLFLLVSQLTRLGLFLWNLGEANTVAAAWPRMFFTGLGFDLAALSLALLPVVIVDVLLPTRWPRVVFVARWLALVVIVFSLLFTATSEFIFWSEFGARFNFIAIDYLVYTHEVFDNIMQSFPVWPLVGLFVGLSLAVAWVLRKPVQEAGQATRRSRLTAAGICVLLAAVFWHAWNIDRNQVSGNHFVNEMAGNGFYTLFSAFRHNELDYARYYPQLPESQLQATLARLNVHQPPQTPASFHAVAGRKKNIVLITVESLSADYLGVFGNPGKLTPNLDRLAGEGLLFTNLYAAGTRTVRGLEALSLSVPPTPGQSIVRRPDNENLVSLGAALDRQGYHSWYVYGGYGYFDNMNYFFSHNGYEVLDRSDVPSNEVGFANAWGMADEYAFAQAEKLLDAAGSQPQFLQVMTTSNHRPYTYPDGRIDIPSPGGRDGAVKYTDYAIGKFLADASKKPWFKDTVFVIVADHCASSAGKTSLPVYRYHIPAIVYAPGFIQPQKMERLTSQIDLAPTLLSLLGLQAEPRFFGRDIFSAPEGSERAFISNYQEVGYLKDGKLVVLAPKRPARMFAVSYNDSGEEVQTEVAPDPVLVDEAIAYYQGAAESFKKGAMKLSADELQSQVKPRS